MSPRRPDSDRLPALVAVLLTVGLTALFPPVAMAVPGDGGPVSDAAPGIFAATSSAITRRRRRR